MNNDYVTMKGLPESERPYERCVKYGVQTLTDAELIAILIKSGTKEKNAIDVAKSLITGASDNSSGLNKLKTIDYTELIKYNGIGRVKAITLLSAIELGKRISLSTKDKTISFTSPRLIADYYIEEMNSYLTEHFYMLLLNSKNNLIRKIEISKGTVNQVIVSPRECMIEALRYNAVSFIILHNHPSGDPTPSTEDYRMTEKMLIAANTLDIKLIDHIVIGDNAYHSMKEEGYI